MTTQKKIANSLVMQGAILAAASIIVRMIGFVYRIPLVNLLKDEGMGYYSNSFDLYSFFLIVSSYGLPSAISKIVAARMTKHQFREAHAIFKAGLALGLLLGIISSSILWLSARWLAIAIGSPDSVYAIQALAPALLIFSIMAVFRGYYQGMNTMIPTAISQIIEQIFNAVFSLVLAAMLVKKGFEYGASGGTIGTGIGALAGLLTLVGIYLIARPDFHKRIARDKTKEIDGNTFSFWKVILMTSIPMVIGTATFHLTNIVDMFMFQNALLFQGYDPKTTVTMYGVLTGKYKLIITLPVSIASALATAAIPSITASLVRNNMVAVKQKIDMAIRTILLISLPSAVGVFVLSKPILSVLFGSENLELASDLLKVGAISIVFFGISTISIGILQGLNRLQTPVISSAKSLIIKVVFNVLLLYVFDTNLYGAVITNIIFAFSSAAFNLREVHKFIGLEIKVMKTVVYPTLAALLMGVVTLGAYILMQLLFKNLILSLVTAMFIAVGIYGVTLLKMGVMGYEDICKFPKGKSLAKILQKLHLV